GRCRGAGRGAAAGDAGVTAAREVADARGSALRRLALRRVLLGRALRHALRVRATARDEAGLPARRPSRALRDGPGAALRQRVRRHELLRHVARAADVLTVVLRTGTVALSGDLRARRCDGRRVRSIRIALGGT